MESSPRHLRVAELRRRLAELATEVLRTEDELVALDSDEQLKLSEPTGLGRAQIPRTPAEKVALFLELFGTRRSVYPKRWENEKTGKSGYSPACDHEWRPGICHKPKVKCAECLHQRFPPLDGRAMEAHLRGTHTLGVYAIATDDTCRFLAADFDGEGWRDDVVAYREAAVRVGVTVAIGNTNLRSRDDFAASAAVFQPPPPCPARGGSFGTATRDVCIDAGRVFSPGPTTCGGFRRRRVTCATLGPLHTRSEGFWSIAIS